MPAYKLPKGQATPSVVDFAVGGPLSAVASKLPGLVKVVSKSGVGFKRHPAVKALLNMLKQDLPMPDIVEGPGQFRVPKTTPIRVPKGFTLPENMRTNPPRQYTTKFGLKAEAKKQAKSYAQFEPEKSAFAKAMQGPPPPAVRGLKELKDVAPVSHMPRPKPPLSRVFAPKSKVNAATKVTEAMVRDIRKMRGNLSEIKAKYPQVSDYTIKDILQRNSWNWVK